jgi:CubicO group peptidase (beta-lactamase class C family)
MVQIVPTEFDDFFRNTQIHGYVHDEGAALMGGLSGNAGLFATASDLLKLYEMYRRYGNYGGVQIISEDIVKEYTSYQFIDNNNRRGLGFDKPALPDTGISKSQAYPCRSASPSSFGHSGYTGTFAWADPEEEIAYVFLSNRVYPTRNNNKISSMNIRTEILQSIYDSIID